MQLENGKNISNRNERKERTGRSYLPETPWPCSIGYNRICLLQSIERAL